MIYTVFPTREDQMPQDFSGYEEAQAYADRYVSGDYEIQSTEGEIV